jgi:uronate dehydrogenase
VYSKLFASMDLSSSTWVITGAGGNVGSSLRQGIAPLVAKLVLLDVHTLQCNHEREEAAVVNICDQEALYNAVQGANGIIHLAGIADDAPFQALADVNITGTFNVLEAARRAGVPRVVFASSNRVTGFYSTSTSVEPGMPARPDGLYGASKVAGEALCRLYVDKFRLQVAAVRIGSFEQKPLDSRQLSTWLSPRDCLGAFVAAMTAPDLTFACFYAVSRNTRRWWALENGESIGIEPQDDAEDHLPTMEVRHVESALTPSDVSHLQGGQYAAATYTLDRLCKPE